MQYKTVALKILQFLAGIAGGMAAYATVALIFKEEIWDRTSSAHFGWIFILPFIVLAIVVFVLIIQSLVTIWLANRNFGAAVVGLWLSIPIMAAVAYGYYQHWSTQNKAQFQANYQEASKAISLSRKLTPPSKEMRTLVIAMRTRIIGIDGVARADRCYAFCAAILKAGIVDSVAVPSDDGYVINELARGQACKAAAANFLTNFRNRNFTGPTIGGSSATSVLASAGYFDECITTRKDRKYNYDIRIDYSKEDREPSNICCYVAEIFENSDGGEKLLGRWRKGWGKLTHVNSFEISDIITELTGKPVDQLLVIQRQLKPFPVTSLEEELVRLEGFVRNGAYIRDRETFLRWIQRVLNDERQRQAQRVDKADRQPGWDRLHLSDRSINLLVATLIGGTAGHQKPTLERFSAWMADDTKQRFKAVWEKTSAS